MLVFAAEFSAMLRVTAVDWVMALPLSDHAPLPSAFTARTCTSYFLPAVRLESVVDVPVPVKECDVHDESPVLRYCTS